MFKLRTALIVKRVKKSSSEWAFANLRDGDAMLIWKAIDSDRSDFSAVCYHPRTHAFSKVSMKNLNKILEKCADWREILPGEVSEDDFLKMWRLFNLMEGAE